MTPYLTRVFATGEYGVVSDLYALAAFLMVIFTYRMETAFFRFSSGDNANTATFSTAAISLLMTTIVLTTMMIVAAQPIAAALQYPDKSEYVVFFALIIGLDALSAIPFARLRMERKPWLFAGAKLLNIVVNVVLILFFLELSPRMIAAGFESLSFLYNADQRISYVFLANLGASLITLIALSTVYLRTDWAFDKALLRKMLTYSMPLVIAGFAGIINEVIDRNLLKYLLPGTIKENLSQVGIYSANYKLAILMTLFTQAFNYAAEPFFFRQSADKKAPSLYANVALAYTLVGCFIFLMVTCYLDMFKYMIGSQFHSGLHIVPILLLANLFLGLYYNVAIWYKLRDMTRMGAAIAIAGALITIVLNCILIPTIGMIGSAWATLACYICMVVLAWRVGYKYFPVPYQAGRIIMHITIALGFYGLHQLTSSGSGFLSLLDGTLILSLYASVVLLVERKHSIPFIKQLYAMLQGNIQAIKK